MPYRHDKATLESRRDELRSELADATRKAELLAEASAEQARLAAELAAVEAKLRRAEGARLPMLEDIRVASPCNASWDDMKGDERVRFCGSCEKNVYNLSAMPRGDAEALLKEREGSICIRLYRRADGTVITNDCSVGVRRKRVRRAVFSALAGAGVLASAATWGFARMGKPAMMGAMAPGVMMGDVPPPAQTATSTPSSRPEIGAAPERPSASPVAPPPARPTMGRMPARR